MRVVLAAVVALMAVVAAGCTAERNGTPVGPNPPSPSTYPKDETYGAPRVSTPLDATRFLKQPCAVLTQAQLAEFSVHDPGESDTDSEIAKHSGPGCLWHRQDTPHSSTLGMSFLTGNKNGLSDTYRGRDRFDFFEATTVDGYPAVFNDLSDGRPNGNCNITVGITDTLTFRAAEGGFRSIGQAVCDRTKQVAAAIIATLKASA